MLSRPADVLIVGSGPTGLLLAGDLAAAGVPVTVLERRDEESNLSRAFAVHARTLEVLDARGLADELVAGGDRIPSVRLFGGEVALERLPTRFPFLLITPQYNTERLLWRRAAELGAELVGGAEVTGLEQDRDGVRVQARERDGQVRTRQAAYLVGADGVRSTVRHALGVPFPGHSVLRSVMLADVRLTNPPADVLTVDSGEPGLVVIAPFGGGWYRIIAWNRRHQVPDSEPVDLDELRELTRQMLGSDYGMHDARWMSRFHNDERQVPHYRVGRAFLAGDAAHVHSPAGGLGLNTGLQDAANLGWKLAAVAAGTAPDGLLDSYHDERHPVGRTVLRLSGSLLRQAVLEPAALRTARDLIGGVAMRIGPVADRAAGLISGIGIGYRSPPGSHRLTGKPAPDLPLAVDDGAPTRLYEALRAGRFVLSPSAVPPADVDGWADRLDLATLAGEAGAAWVLVRPDGHVAWASDETDQARRVAGLRAALRRWCGTATPAQSALGGRRLP